MAAAYSAIVLLAGTALSGRALADGGAGSGGDLTYGGAGGTDNATTPGGAGSPGVSGQSGGGGGGGAGTSGGSGGQGNGTTGGAGGGGGSAPGAGGFGGTDSANGGGGGGGGAHGGVNATLPATPLLGGNGGAGGNGTAVSGDGGGGGAGGYGAVVTGSGNLGTLSTNLRGGNGGAGGRAQAPTYYGGNGGSGGIGLLLTNAASATLTITSTVQGGDGGAGGAATVASGFGLAGAGGVGIAGANLSIILNGGTISGGLSGDSAIRADAIAFSGGSNTLTLNAGTLTGNISIGSGGSVAFNEAGSYALTNAITGAGAISHTGAGTLTLTNASTYTGGTTISSGVLAAGHADTSGALNVIDVLGTGAVTLDGGNLRSTVSASLTQDLTFNANKTSILSAAAGQTLTLGGDTFGGNSGTVVFGANTIAQFGTAGDTGVIEVGRSAGFTIDGTSHVVIGGGTLRDFNDQLTNIMSQVSSITLNSGATLDFNDSLSQTLVNLNGASTSRILTGSTGTNTLTIFTSGGGTNIFSGVISGSHPVSFNGTGTMILDGNNTYTGGTTICWCMTLQLGNGGTTGSIVGDVINESRLIFNRSNTYTFNGVISDIGDVVQNGTGNTVLTATHTYTGATTVNAGILSVNGDISSSSGVTVNSGGTLGGNGFVPTTTINAGGTLAPGNSIGTITVSGDLTFNSGSNYNIEVSPSAADRTNVTGAAALAGIVNATYAAGSYISKRYTILNATGGLTGTFGSLVNANLPTNFTSSLSYDSKNVYLDLVLSYVAPTAPAFGNRLNGNQQGVAHALTDYFDTTGGIPTVFGTLSPAGLSQVAGETGATPIEAGFTASNQFMNLLFSQGGSAASGGFGSMGYAPEKKLDSKAIEAYAAVTPFDRRPPDFSSRWGVWGSGYGGNATVKGDAAAGSSDTTSRVYGLAGGAEYRFTPETVAGFALGGAGADVSTDGGSGRADIFQAGAYVRHLMGAAYLSGALAYGWQRVTTDRTVTVSGTDKLEAGFDAQTLAARVEGGYRFATPRVGLTPYAALQSTTFFLPSYNETATSGFNQFALSYASQTVTNLRTELGLRVDKTFVVAEGVFVLNGRAAWAHDSNTDRLATATFQTLPGATFTVNGAKPAADGALLSAGAQMRWGNGFSLSATFDGEFSDTTASYAGRGTVAYTW